MESPRARVITDFPPGLRISFKFPVSSFHALDSGFYVRVLNWKPETGNWTYGVTVRLNGALCENEPEVAVTVSPE